MEWALQVVLYMPTLGVTIVLGIAPRQLGVHRTIEWEPTELVRLLVCQSVVVVICCLCPPSSGGGLWCQGGLPACPLLWVAVNTAVAAHLCKGILASVNAGMCGPCMHLQDIDFRSALL